MSDLQGPRIPAEERSRRGLTAGRIVLALIVLALLVPLTCQALRGSDTEEASQGSSQEGTEETTSSPSALLHGCCTRAQLVSGTYIVVGTFPLTVGKSGRRTLRVGRLKAWASRSSSCRPFRSPELNLLEVKSVSKVPAGTPEFFRFLAICRYFSSEPLRTRTWNLEIKSLKRSRHRCSSLYGNRINKPNLCLALPLLFAVVRPG